MTPALAYPWQNNWIPLFLEFLSKVSIPSKELKVPGPITPYESQYRFLRELDAGLTVGQRFLVILKARQLGLSTVMLILDIFWLYMYPGLQGGLVTDTDENRIQFRQTISQALASLPPGFRVKVKLHNKAGLILDNGSRLQYIVAGKKKNPDLGRSRGLNFMHATELSSWGDQDGINSLIDTLSEEHPDRLYICESTAKGYNVFYDLHKAAKENALRHAARPVFIGWWAKDNYRIAAGTPAYEQWWSAQPVLTDQEQEMSDLILADYGWEMTTEQWAWWRRESYSRSETNLLQEFPWHEKVAFQVTGSPFFSIKRLNEDVAFISNNPVAFDGFKYDLGDDFAEMKCSPVFTAAESQLKIWERPIRNAKYALGVDVAGGRSATNDRHVISVFRCFADKAVQVAEWATSEPETRHVAWVLAHLAGSYRDCMINLELTGPGQQVMNEMRYLRQQIAFMHLRSLEATFEAKDALHQARWYLYHRTDTPGAGYTYGFRTNSDTKTEMLNSMRDEYNCGRLAVRSIPCLEEMTTMIQSGVSISAISGKKDDRPFAAGLANFAWTQWIRFPMLADHRTYEIEMAKQLEYERQGQSPVTGIIPSFFAARARERQEADLERFFSQQS